MSGLTVENIHLWRGDHQVLDAVSFAAASGDLVHISGANGAGKTTLLRVLCGLTMPEEGEIRWRGRPISDDPVAYRSQLAFFGHRDGINDDLSVIENLRYGLSLTGSAPDDSDLRETLGELRMEEKAGHPCRSLSAGQRRRVALARIILSGAAVWLMDEPYTHLDTQGRDRLNKRIVQKLNDGGMVILTTHEASLLPRSVAVEVVL